MRDRSALWLLAVAAAALAALAGALVSQHVYGMQPCSWCVLQRLITLVIALVALLGLLLPGLRRVAGGGVLLLSAGGVAAALWQHFVASASASCVMTLADRIVGATQLGRQFPEVFAAYASCAEANVRLFGVPYAFWSLALFVLLGVVAVWVLGQRRA